MTVRALSNSWLTRWRLALRGFKPQAQVTGYWLALQADSDGVIDGVDWEQLAIDTNLTINTLRRELRDNSELVKAGLVKREPRQWGNTFGATKYQLFLPEKENAPSP